MSNQNGPTPAEWRQYGVDSIQRAFRHETLSPPVEAGFAAIRGTQLYLRSIIADYVADLIEIQSRHLDAIARFDGDLEDGNLHDHELLHDDASAICGELKALALEIARQAEEAFGMCEAPEAVTLLRFASRVQSYASGISEGARLLRVGRIRENQQVQLAAVPDDLSGLGDGESS